MGRIKNYENHINNLKQEISATEKKLTNLREQMTSLLKEKEEYDVSTLYRYIRANNISMGDIQKKFQSDEGSISSNEDVAELEELSKKSTIAQSKTKSNAKNNTKNTSNNSKNTKSKKTK